MNPRLTITLTMGKFLQRTCLALNHSNAEFHTNSSAATAIWTCLYKQHDSPRNSNAMTPALDKWCSSSKRFYSKFATANPHHPTASLGTSPPLCEDKAYDLVLALKDSERLALRTALDKYDAVKMKEGFEGKLAATHWRTKFGRLSKVPPLANVDPTGSFCTFPEDWLRKKAEERAIPPSTSDLYKIFFVNAVPFVVFGFLDNFCMIMAGDSIEQIFGTFMCISTMAAAGLGNTISDVLGIGSAFYVERFCAFLGLKPPDLGPIQLEMKSSRRSANLGRIIGITIGCLIGMCPLLFLRPDHEEEKADTSSKTPEKANDPS